MQNQQDDSNSIQINNLNNSMGSTNLGISANQLNTEDSWELIMGLDKSLSMSNLRQTVIDEMNIHTRSIADSDAGDSMLMSLYVFDHEVRKLWMFKTMDDVPDLTLADYNPSGGTALVDALNQMIDDAEAYRSYLLKAGQTSVRVIVTLITDGAELNSKTPRSTVAARVDKLLKTEQWTFNLIGLGDPAEFTKIAQELNIPSVMTAGKSSHDFRIALGLHSKGAITAHSSRSNPTSNFFTQTQP